MSFFEVCREVEGFEDKPLVSLRFFSAVANCKLMVRLSSWDCRSSICSFKAASDNPGVSEVCFIRLQGVKALETGLKKGFWLKNCKVEGDD